MNTVKVGIMPGRIEELAVESGTTVATVLEQQGLETSGYDVKADGATLTDLNKTIDEIGTILLVKQVKGNAGTVKIGVMPGRIEEYAVEDGTSVQEAIANAGLETSGYDVKADGATLTDLSASINGYSTILLVKQVKGNSQTIKVGVMPGRIEEYALPSNATIAEVLEQAGLSATGYDVKVDGATKTDLTEVADGIGTILLVKQVKGNK